MFHSEIDNFTTQGFTADTLDVRYLYIINTMLSHNVRLTMNASRSSLHYEHTLCARSCGVCVCACVRACVCDRVSE